MTTAVSMTTQGCTADNRACRSWSAVADIMGCNPRSNQLARTLSRRAASIKWCPLQSAFFMANHFGMACRVTPHSLARRDTDTPLAIIATSKRAPNVGITAPCSDSLSVIEFMNGDISHTGRNAQFGVTIVTNHFDVFPIAKRRGLVPIASAMQNKCRAARLACRILSHLPTAYRVTPHKRARSAARMLDERMAARRRSANIFSSLPRSAMLRPASGGIAGFFTRSIHAKQSIFLA